MDISEWHYRCLEGRIAKHVARGTDNPSVIIKTALSMLAKGKIRPAALQSMLADIDKRSVQPFLHAPGRWNQPDRISRFKFIEASLHFAAAFRLYDRSGPIIVGS